MRYIIIGSGVAGNAATESIRSVDRMREIVMIGDDQHGFYSRPGLAYYLTGELSDKALYPFTIQDYRRMNLHYVKGHVVSFDRDGHSLALDDKQISLTINH